MKDSLAIAYAAKRMAQKKKMAKGGMVNEDLAPMHEPEHGAEDLVLKEEKLSPFAQEHEDIDEPLEPKETYVAKLAHGGMTHRIVSKIMAKRMAQGGELTPRYDYLDENASYPDPDGEEHDVIEDDWFDAPEKQEPEYEDPKEKRKRVIRGIMGR